MIPAADLAAMARRAEANGGAPAVSVRLLAAALSEAMAALKHLDEIRPWNHCDQCTAAAALLAAFYGEGK